MIISICIYIRPYILWMMLWIFDFFCVLGGGFIDIDTYLYGIPFKDDSEGVVSYSLGEVIWDFSLVGVGWVLESWLQVKMP